MLMPCGTDMLLVLKVLFFMNKTTAASASSRAWSCKLTLTLICAMCCRRIWLPLEGEGAPLIEDLVGDHASYGFWGELPAVSPSARNNPDYRRAAQLLSLACRCPCCPTWHASGRNSAYCMHRLQSGPHMPQQSPGTVARHLRLLLSVIY